MLQSYTIRQDADLSWSLLATGTGAPVRLAGIPQTGLTKIEAEIMLELLDKTARQRPSVATRGERADAA